MSTYTPAIIKCKKGCGSMNGGLGDAKKYCGEDWFCDICQAKLQTWKQALTNQLKELDEDINFLIGINKKFSFSTGRSDVEVKQKLAQKQAEKEEVSKLIGEMK